MLLFAISLVALVLGPLLFWAFRRIPAALSALDGFVMTAICGLVAVHILPHAVSTTGALVLVVAAVGFLGPGLAEKTLHRSAAQVHRLTTFLALGGLALHAVADGMALAIPEDHGSLLPIAVLLHRLPVAMTAWWLVSGTRGRSAASAVLAIIGLATVAGFFAGTWLLQVIESDAFAYFQALVAGSLLHVIFHQPGTTREEAAGPQTRAGAGVGALVGLVAVVALADEHLPRLAIGAIDFDRTFVALLLETAPALLLAFAVAGVVQALVPKAPRNWLRAGGASREAMRGVVFGLPLPICSCGVVPLYSALIRQGVPATAGMAFLVATPELGIDALLISMPLLGGELTVIRVIAAVAVALLVGRVIGALAGEPKVPPPATATEPKGSFAERLRRGLSFGFRDIVDDTGPWILFGLVIAAFAEPLLDEGWLQHLPANMDVLIFGLLGIPVYVCASGATPLAAVLIHKGVSPGAAIAFLLAGPATNLTTFGVLSRLHSRAIALWFGGAIAVVAIAIGFGVNAIAPDLSGISLHASAMVDHSVWAYAAAAGLGLLYAASLLRIGPRGFISQITDPFHIGHDHDHCHDDCHDDCHDPGDSHDGCHDPGDSHDHDH